VISVHCQTEPGDLLARHHILLSVSGSSSRGEGTSGQMHPDDLKGLQEWVFAKQHDLKDDASCFFRYSAPWRVG